MELAEGLNVVWGANEAGKTSLLDFLVGQLFRWERPTGTRLETLLPGLDRFGRAAEAGGLVEVRLGDEILSYPSSDSLLHRLELDHASLAGLFCVRSGELDLPGGAKGDFWPELKKLLSGLPRGVDTLREAVHREARLTPSGQPSDRGSPGPRTRHRELVERIARLETLEARLDRAATYEAKLAAIDEKLGDAERARSARIVSLAALRRGLRERLAGLPEVPRDALREWRELVAEREGELTRRLERTRAAAAEAERESGERADRLREAGAAAAALRARLEATEEARLGRRAAELSVPAPAGEREPGVVSRWIYAGLMGLMLLLVVLALALPGHLLTRIAFPVLVILVPLAIFVLLWRNRLRQAREARRERAERRRRLREDAVAAGLEVEDDASPADIAERLRRLEVEAARLESAAGAAREAAAEAERREDRVREQVEEAVRREREIESRTRALAELVGTDELSEARARETDRDEVAAELARIERSLAELAGPDPARWEAAASSVDAARAAGDGEHPGEHPAWDAAEKERLEREATRLRSEYRDLRDAFVQAGLSTPEDVLTELRAARAEASELELDWEAGRIAGEVFATMDEVLERRLSEALAGSGPLSPGALLERITDRYRALVRGPEGGLGVVDREGREFPIEALSRGTRDQVHLALRAGLARAALASAGTSEPGFFLLDDAFLTADWPRRERLVAAVAELASAGWQVTYLTCDDHLRDLFVHAGARLEEL